MNKEYEYMSSIKVENKAENSIPAIEFGEPNQIKPTRGTIFMSNFLNWGNIFQSFIGTSILSLPYYCYRVK